MATTLEKGFWGLFSKPWWYLMWFRSWTTWSGKSKTFLEFRTTYAVDILYFSFNFTVSLQFFVVNRNLQKISELIHQISDTLKGDVEVFAKDHERRFMKFARVALFMLFFTDSYAFIEELTSTSGFQLMSYSRYFFDTSYPPVHLTLNIITMLSQVSGDICHALMLLCYFDICIHIESLYERLRIKFELIELAKSEKMEKSLIANFVEAHIETIEVATKIIKNFKLILAMDFFLLTFAMSIILLLFTSSEQTAESMVYALVLLFVLLLFCLPSELVENQVRRERI